MYSKNNIQKGKELLGLTNNELIWDVIIPNIENFMCFHEQEKYRERFKLNPNLTQKQLKEKIKETNKFIEYYKNVIRESQGGLGHEQLEQYVKFKEKLNNFNKKPKDNGDLKKAKEYPIETLLEFKRNGFTDCIFHAKTKQNTPSLHLDKRRNKVHCFSCGKDADSIDVYMELYGVSLNEAIKRLS